MSENTSNLGLTPRQRKAIMALADGKSIKDTASAATVSTRTVYRWRRDPTFAAALRMADSDQLELLARSVTAASKDALSVLVTILNDKKASAGLRLRAADLILQHRAKFFEMLTISARLGALERAVFSKDEPS